MLNSPDNLTVHASLPSTNIDTLLASDPNAAIQLAASNGLKVFLSVNATSLSVRPYYLENGYWVGLGADGNTAIEIAPVKADFANALRKAVSGRYTANNIGGWWILVKEAGDVSSKEKAMITAVDR